MTNTEDSSLIFSSGFVIARDWVLIPAELTAFAGESFDFTRVAIFKEGEWLYFDLEMTIRSVVGDFCDSDYYLARDGRISVTIAGGATEERIEDAGTGPGKLGYVSMIRRIGKTLYVCGVAGQVYRREPTGWVHFDREVLDPQGPPKALDLYCIDGSSENDIYTVGQSGLIWHFDGRSWNRLAPPTQHDLNWLRCVSPTDVYLCGNYGGFFKGNAERWEDFSAPEIEDDFWCVEVFDNKVYLAAQTGLFVFDGKSVKPVDTGLDPTPDGHHLHANDGVLWSFGQDHLAFYDGKKWKLVKHPDNPDPSQKITIPTPPWKR